MYKNKLNELLRPYSFFKDTTKYSIVLKEFKDDLDKWNFKDIKLKPIKKFLVDNNIASYRKINHYQTEENIHYPAIYTTAMSKSWIDQKKYNFYLNEIHISEYDDNLKVLHHQGYIYLCFKNDITINSLLVMRTNLSATVEKLNSYVTMKDKNVKLEIPFNKKFKYEPNENNGLKLVINSPYISIKEGENIIDYLLRYTENPIDWLLNNKIKSYLLINDKGILSESDKVKMDPLFFSVEANSKIKLFLFYEGVDPENYRKEEKNLFTYKNKYYLEDILSELFRNENTRNYLKSHSELLLSEDESNVFKYFQEYDSILSPNIPDYLLGFNYDLFMEAYKINHSTKINFTYDDLSLVKDTKYSNYDYKNNQYVEEELLKLTFKNYMNNPFEIYIFGRLYTSSYISDRQGFYTTIYINKSNLLSNFKITEEQLKSIKGCVLIKSHDYKRINYNNITSDFNGILPISSDWFTIHNKKIFDNGYLIKDSDIELNTIRPSGLVCVFPKRRFKNHSITIIGNRLSDTKITSNKYEIKVKNLTQTEIDNFNVTNKVIYKNLFYTDYIDYRYNIYIGPYLLMENFDYKILAPNLIEFLRPICIYKDEKDSDYIDILIEYEGEVEDTLLKIYKHKSYKYRLFNNKDFMKEFIKGREDTEIVNERDDTLSINEKGKYPNKNYKYHQMVSKYFSSERLYTAEKNKYGDKLFEELYKEFPEFVNKVNDIYIIQDNLEIDSLEDTPRRVVLPEVIDLDELITKHFESVNILRFENKLLDKESSMRNELYRYKSELYKEDLLLSTNIPINYLIDKY